MPKANQILLVLTDRWCDWEASYAIASASSFFDYRVDTLAVDLQPKVSMGGLPVTPNYKIAGFDDFSDTAMVILPGGLSWEEQEYDEIADFVKKVLDRGIPLAAICGATTFLCRHGFLNHVRHTGDSLELFQSQKGYTGESLYVPAQVVADQGIITANETAAVEFAYEIFKVLKLDSPEGLRQWYDTFQNGAVR